MIINRLKKRVIFSLFLLFGIISLITFCERAAMANSLVSLNLSLNEQQQLLHHMQVLSSDAFQGRRIGTLGSVNSQNYLVKVLTQQQVTPYAGHYRHAFVQHSWFTEKHGTNIIAAVKGRLHPDKYIVLTAHYDHLGVKNHQIYHGADDNASGTAALLALSLSIQKAPLSHSVLFIFTDGEESNLLGSKHFIQQNNTLLKQVLIDINLDMLSGDQRTTCLHFISSALSKNFNVNNQQLIKLASASDFCLKHGFKMLNKAPLYSRHRIDWQGASDHASFHRAGIPYIYYGVGSDVNYHTQRDQYQRTNLPFFIRATQQILQQIEFVDRHSTS